MTRRLGRRILPWMFSLLMVMTISSYIVIFVLHERTLPKGNALHGVEERQYFSDVEIWRKPKSNNFEKCIHRTTREIKQPMYNSNGYILVHANGGLNQMKMGISDIVAITKIMNATLVLPYLDSNSFWEDKSGFKDLFDWKHFMHVLKQDIHIVEHLPDQYRWMKRYRVAPISWSMASYYKRMAIHVFKKTKVIVFTHSDSRLANNKLIAPIQRLRCRAMYEALKYAKEIEELGMKLVDRLRSNNEPYIALHLRYEKDMVAFTGCDHNLTRKEAQILKKLRDERPNWKDKNIDSKAKRLQGLCPMTPREAALFLEALGFPSNTKIYLAAGQAFGENGIKDLIDKYPNVYDHFSLVNEDEIEPFLNHQNQLAATDYVVAVESDVFVFTYDGSMAKSVSGERRSLGFRKTINPDRHKFVRLIDKLDQGKITWDKFSTMVSDLHKNITGAPRYRIRGPTEKLEENFYANPFPECFCIKSRNQTN